MTSGFRRESTPIRTLIFNLSRIVLFLLKPVRTLMFWGPGKRVRSRSHALKSGLIRFFFIQNSVFLSQIPPAFLQTIQIPPEFLQANRPWMTKIWRREISFFNINLDRLRYRPPNGCIATKRATYYAITWSIYGLEIYSTIIIYSNTSWNQTPYCH